MIRIMVAAQLLLASAACSAGRLPPDSSRESLTVDGIARSYVVRLPPELAQRAELVPLVLVLHGGGGNASGTERMTGFTAKAREEGFIVVYPEGTGRLPGRLLTWNARHCCGYAMENGVNDVAFIRALIDRLRDDYAIDPRRIYAAGMSNGAMMAHRLGIELSRTFAAIAPVVGTVFGDEERPEQPVSAIILNGALDRSVPPEGGPPGGRFDGAWDGTPAKPAVEQAVFWAAANGCSSAPERPAGRSAMSVRYGCPNGRAVEFHLVEENGHAWPGGERGSLVADRPNPSFNATDVIWEFFKNHPRPE